MVCTLYNLIIATYEKLLIESRSKQISGCIGNASDFQIIQKKKFKWICVTYNCCKITEYCLEVHMKLFSCNIYEWNIFVKKKLKMLFSG